MQTPVPGVGNLVGDGSIEQCSVALTHRGHRYSDKSYKSTGRGKTLNTDGGVSTKTNESGEKRIAKRPSLQ